MGFKASVRGVGESLSLELPKSAAGWKPGAELWGVAFGSDGGVLLRNEAPYLAGNLGSFGIGDVLGQVVSGVRTGRLVFVRGEIRKTVTFRDGQIVFATSTEVHERLGAALARRKLVGQEDLDRALGQVKPGTKLGQVLTRLKLVSPSALYAAIAFLVREIVIGLLAEREGDFLFLEGPVSSEDAVKLPERTRDLVLEGLKQADELWRLRRRVPAVLRLHRGAKPEGGAALELWEALGTGGATVAALRANFSGAERELLAAVEAMSKQGQAREELPSEPEARAVSAPPAAGAAGSPLERYAALARTICDALRGAGRGLADLQSFFEDPLPGLEASFKGVALSEDGALDVRRLLANTGGDTALSRARAYEALDAFVSYALFSAKNALAPELAEKLARDFRRIQEGTEG